MYSDGRRCVIQVVGLAILAVIVLVLILSLIRLKKSDYSALSNRMAARSRSGLTVLKPCPVCATLLEPGERVHTVVYSGEPTGRRVRDEQRPKDALVHMYGCPHCYPANRKTPRICPVCKQTIPEDGHLVARMFIKDKRKHVHVLGCTACRPSAGVQRSRRSG